MHLVLEKGDTLAVDVIIKKVQLYHSKNTLVQVDENTVLTNTFKQKPELLQLLF